jgi:hypothetical protein
VSRVEKSDETNTLHPASGIWKRMKMKDRHERLRFDYIKTEESPEECSVEVGLSFAGRTIQKTVNGKSDEISRLKSAATATLEAVREAIEERFDCTLADLDHVHALGKNLIAVLVDISFEGRDFQVFGSCQIAGSVMDAAAKAALNATNRFVELANRS